MANVLESAKDWLVNSKIDHQQLLDKLSESMAVERDGQRLYEAAIQQISDRETAQRFQDFYQQTRRHQDIVAELINALGGDPSYMSPAARVAQRKAEALLRTMTEDRGLSLEERELNAIENIVLAETKDQMDWEVLVRIAIRAGNEALQSIMRRSANEVVREEKTHLQWAMKRFAELAMESLKKTRERWQDLD